MFYRVFIHRNGKTGKFKGAGIPKFCAVKSTGDYYEDPTTKVSVDTENRCARPVCPPFLRTVHTE